MKIAILGYGSQGQSVYEYFKGSNNSITVCDQSIVEDLPNDVDKHFGDNYLDRLDQYDLIFRSPAIHPSDIVKVNGEKILAKVTTNTNEFFELCSTKNIIGVTGTKG